MSNNTELDLKSVDNNHNTKSSSDDEDEEESKLAIDIPDSSSDTNSSKNKKLDVEEANTTKKDTNVNTSDIETGGKLLHDKKSEQKSPSNV